MTDYDDKDYEDHDVITHRDQEDGSVFFRHPVTNEKVYIDDPVLVSNCCGAEMAGNEFNTTSFYHEGWCGDCGEAAVFQEAV